MAAHKITRRERQEFEELQIPVKDGYVQGRHAACNESKIKVNSDLTMFCEQCRVRIIERHDILGLPMLTVRVWG